MVEDHLECGGPAIGITELPNQFARHGAGGVKGGSPGESVKVRRGASNNEEDRDAGTCGDQEGAREPLPSSAMASAKRYS